MFIKPFKLRSNVQLKASDHKKLRNRAKECFPNLSDNDLSDLFPSKSTITLIKLVTSAGNNSIVYAFDKRPMFFEEENMLVPTIYTCWLVPHILPYFTTHPDVLPRIAKGADLMLPGVIKTGTGMNMYGRYKKGQLMAVNLTSNKATVGIGRLLRSSDDLYMSGGHGPCVKFLNIFGDKLWNIEPSVTLQLPNLSPVMGLPTKNDFPALGECPKKKAPEEEINEMYTVFNNLEFKNENNLEETISSEDINDNTKNDNNTEIKENMDAILKEAFLIALKKDGRNLSLPILTSNFYRNSILPVAKTQIDLKQTSFKKLTKFLNEMAEEGFIVVKEETKGVEKIVSVNFENEDLINFIIPDNNTTIETTDAQKPAQLFHVEMTELYIITDETIPFFTKFNYQKNQGIPAIQIKKLLKEYVSKSQLTYADTSKKIFKLDGCLSQICDNEALSMDNLYHTILSKMTHSFEMRGKNETNCNKPPIQMSLATRSGNKKVTLVSNLESYGIILSEFGKVCKQGAAASTSIIKSPNQKQDQFQIQGNQIKFLFKMLTETYKIPAKQIHGLDLAKKEKKKKN